MGDNILIADSAKSLQCQNQVPVMVEFRNEGCDMDVGIEWRKIDQVKCFRYLDVGAHERRNECGSREESTVSMQSCGGWKRGMG